LKIVKISYLGEIRNEGPLYIRQYPQVLPPVYLLSIECENRKKAKRPWSLNALQDEFKYQPSQKRRTPYTSHCPQHLERPRARGLRGLMQSDRKTMAKNEKSSTRALVHMYMHHIVSYYRFSLPISHALPD